jgi:hypothetical protein
MVAAVVFRSWVCNVCHVRQAQPHISLLDVASAWDGQASLLDDPVDDDEICLVADGEACP